MSIISAFSQIGHDDSFLNKDYIYKNIENSLKSPINKIPLTTKAKSKKLKKLFHIDPHISILNTDILQENTNKNIKKIGLKSLLTRDVEIKISNNNKDVIRKIRYNSPTKANQMTKRSQNLSSSRKSEKSVFKKNSASDEKKPFFYDCNLNIILDYYKTKNNFDSNKNTISQKEKESLSKNTSHTLLAKIISQSNSKSKIHKSTNNLSLPINNNAEKQNTFQHKFSTNMLKENQKNTLEENLLPKKSIKNETNISNFNCSEEGFYITTEITNSNNTMKSHQTDNVYKTNKKLISSNCKPEFSTIKIGEKEVFVQNHLFTKKEREILDKNRIIKLPLIPNNYKIKVGRKFPDTFNLNLKNDSKSNENNNHLTTINNNNYKLEIINEKNETVDKSQSIIKSKNSKDAINNFKLNIPSINDKLKENTGDYNKHLKRSKFDKKNEDKLPSVLNTEENTSDRVTKNYNKLVKSDVKDITQILAKLEPSRFKKKEELELNKKIVNEFKNLNSISESIINIFNEARNEVIKQCDNNKRDCFNNKSTETNIAILMMENLTDYKKYNDYIRLGLDPVLIKEKTELKSYKESVPTKSSSKNDYINIKNSSIFSSNHDSMVEDDSELRTNNMYYNNSTKVKYENLKKNNTKRKKENNISRQMTQLDKENIHKFL
jgi:hypothetical protein